MGIENEPGLLIDLKCVLPATHNRLALEKALKHKEEWLSFFMDDVGVWAVRDLIEDLSLQLRIYKEKLAISEEECAKLSFISDIIDSIEEMDNGDIVDYE